MIAPMNFQKSSEEKEFELEMLEDLKRLDFWVTGKYRDVYDISQDTTVYALKIMKRVRGASVVSGSY